MGHSYKTKYKKKEDDKESDTKDQKNDDSDNDNYNSSDDDDDDADKYFDDYEFETDRAKSLLAGSYHFLTAEIKVFELYERRFQMMMMWTMMTMIMTKLYLVTHFYIIFMFSSINIFELKTFCASFKYRNKNNYTQYAR